MESFELLPDTIVERILSFLETDHSSFHLTCKRFYSLYKECKAKKLQECLTQKQHLTISVLEDPSVTGIKEIIVEHSPTSETISQLESNNTSTSNSTNTQEQTQLPNDILQVDSSQSSGVVLASPLPPISPEEFVDNYAMDMNSKKITVMYAYDILDAFVEKKIPLKLLGLLRSKLVEPRARTLVLAAVICVIAKDELINKLKKCIERINQHTSTPTIPVPTNKKPTTGKNLTINVPNPTSKNLSLGMDVITPQQVIVDTLNLMLGLSFYSEDCYNTELKRVILASFPRCLNERECEKSLYKKLNAAMFFQLLYGICNFTQLNFTLEAKTRLLLGFDTNQGYHSSNSLPSVGPSSPASPRARHSGIHMDLMESISKTSPSSSYSSSSSGAHTPPQSSHKGCMLEPRDIAAGLGAFLEKCQLSVPMVHSENLTPDAPTHSQRSQQFDTSRSISIGNPSRPAEVELQTDWIAVDAVPVPKQQKEQQAQPKLATSPVADLASTFKWYKKKMEVSISKLAQKK